MAVHPVAESARLRAGLSAVRPGDVAVIQFNLGSFRGSDIFLPDAPVSVEIGCASRTAVAGVTADVTGDRSAGSCRGHCGSASAGDGGSGSSPP